MPASITDCGKCQELLEKLREAIHVLNNKLTVVSGCFEFVHEDPALTEQHRKMLLLAVQASREYADVAYKTSMEIGQFLHEIEVRFHEEKK